ncbi:MAG: DNA repair protein RecO [Nitrospirae bacterium]|nr:DNA repair protein RecO [Nitrospirota bacterium]
MLRRTEGIVVKSFPYGDADLIVSFFTLDFGMLKVFAKSPRKIKSRFGSSLEPFSRDTVSFLGKEHASLPRLTQADIVYSFQGLREDFGTFVRATELLEITAGLIPEMEPHRELYAMLLDTMRQFENGGIQSGKGQTGRVQPNAVAPNAGYSNRVHVNGAQANGGANGVQSRWKLFYKVKLLSIAGFSPRLDGCLKCGKKGSVFHVNEGAIICPGCSADHSAVNAMPSNKNYILLSQGAINLYEHITRWRWNKLGRIVPPQQLVDELDALMNEHIRFRTEREIRTRAFMEKCPPATTRVPGL